MVISLSTKVYASSYHQHKMMVSFLFLCQLQSRQKIGYDIRTLTKIHLFYIPHEFLGTKD